MNSDSIQISDAILENKNELEEVAHLYAAAPLSWDKTFQVTDAESNQKWLLEKRSRLKCLVACLDSKIVGIHIIQRLENRPEACLIKTLWVAAEYRRKGIASKFKAAGEAWARETGCNVIVANVGVLIFLSAIATAAHKLSER